jgi:hypothetical protein
MGISAGSYLRGKGKRKKRDRKCMYKTNIYSDRGHKQQNKNFKNCSCGVQYNRCHTLVVRINFLSGAPGENQFSDKTKILQKCIGGYLVKKW